MFEGHKNRDNLEWNIQNNECSWHSSNIQGTKTNVSIRTKEIGYNRMGINTSRTKVMIITEINLVVEDKYNVQTKEARDNVISISTILFISCYSLYNSNTLILFSFSDSTDSAADILNWCQLSIKCYYLEFGIDCVFL